MCDLRASLQGGRIDATLRHAVSLETAVTALAGLDLTRPEAEALRAEATALDLLLRAAIEGIRAVHRRLEILNAAHRGLDSYNRHGQALRITATPTPPGRRI